MLSLRPNNPPLDLDPLPPPPPPPPTIWQVAGTVHARVAATSSYDEAQATEALLLFFVPAASGALHAADDVADNVADDVAELHAYGRVSDALARLVTAISKRIVSSRALEPRNKLLHLPSC